MTRANLRIAKEKLSAKLVREFRHLRLPHKFLTEYDASSVTCRYHRTRWYRMMDSESAVLRKEVNARLVSGRDTIALIQIVGFDIDPLVSNDEILDNLDSHSQADYDIACALCNQWKYLSTSVSNYGPILELRRAWNHHSFPRMWARTGLTLIDREFNSYSIMMAKAFPLEHEGLGSNSKAVQRIFNRRRTAMMEYYGRLLDLAPFGKQARAGWMWNIHPRLKDIIDLRG